MKYKINGKCLEVTNEIEEFNDFIFGRFSQFEITNDKPDNFLYFKNNKVEMSINKQYKVLNNKVVKTDIYPIICNVIASLINNENNMFVHSVVVSKNNIGKLIVGNFGQGKTTLANAFTEKGYEINSTDQTWLQVKDGELYQKIGSRFGLSKNSSELLDSEKSKKEIKINQIIRIVGLCDNGETSFNYNSNMYHKIKNLSQFCNWNCTMPIFTENVTLYNTNTFVRMFLENLADTEIQFVDVRGDKTKILNELGVG